MKSILTKGVLWITIILLAYFGLYGNITNEIHVRKVMDERKLENIQRLKDLREVQLEYKRHNGEYADNPDSLVYFLFNTSYDYINTEKADADSIPSNMRKWKKIQRRLLKDKIDPYKEAKRIYRELGGRWNVLTEKQKVKKGYISVEYFSAKELFMSSEYKNSRENIYEIDLNSLSNLTRIYKKQTSFSNFSQSFTMFDEDIKQKIKLENVYTTINKHYETVLSLSKSDIISLEQLRSLINKNNKNIENINILIDENKYKQENAEGLVNATNNQREAYTETIGSDVIDKVRQKAAIKSEKGKKLKGRKGVIFQIITQQDSTENANKIIIKDCKNNIIKLESEISAREKLNTILLNNIQAISDINQMKNKAIEFNQYFYNENYYKNNSKLNDLIYYTLNQEIKIIKVLKKGNSKTPSLPKEWKKAQLQADFLVEQSMDADLFEKVNTKYKNNGGKWRSLTEEEGYARGLITVTTLEIKDKIFDELYMKNRAANVNLNLDSLVYIPHTNNKYSFSSKKTVPNDEQRRQGETVKYYFEITASYDDIYLGLDKEEKILRNHSERENIQVGSLEKTIINGNWGE